MKKKTVTFLTVGLALTLIGGAGGLAAYLNGASGISIGPNAGLISLGGHTTEGKDGHAMETKADNLIEQQHYDLSKMEPFDRVHIQVGVAEAIVSQQAGDGSVTAENFPEGKFECSVDGGTLYIRTVKEQNLNLNTQPYRKVTVVLPQEAELSEIQLTLGVGEAEVKQLKADKISLTGGAGRLEAEGLTAEETVITGGIGELDIQELDCASLEVHSGAGSTSIGANVRGTASFSSGMGELAFEGKLQDFSLSSGMGSVDMELKGRASDYGFTVKNGMGSVVIDGVEMGRKGQLGSSDAAYQASLSSGMGEVTISFDED